MQEQQDVLELTADEVELLLDRRHATCLEIALGDGQHRVQHQELTRQHRQRHLLCGLELDCGYAGSSAS
jgi:hypothetical protein